MPRNETSEGAGQIQKRRRDSISPYVGILRAIGSGAQKSRILHGVNLSFGRCGRYLDDLTGKRLIKIGKVSKW